MDANPYEVTPEEQQAILAQVLRGKQAMQLANEQANRFNNLAAISQMANNPGAAKAAAFAQSSAQKQYGMEKLLCRALREFLAKLFRPSRTHLARTCVSMEKHTPYCVCDLLGRIRTGRLVVVK